MPRRPKTSPRRPPRQKRSAETIAVLLTATDRILSVHGYAGATTNRIAEAAGVSIGTLYHYFPTKEALIEALVHSMWESELSLIEEHTARLHDAPLATATRELVHAMVDAVCRRRELYRRWYAEASHLGQLELGLEMTQRGVRLVHDSLVRHRREVRPKNLPLAADFVIKMVLAGVRTAARDYPNELASGEFAEELFQMIARYLLVKPP
jgi:AcrR family transcriptional regulator